MIPPHLSGILVSAEAKNGGSPASPWHRWAAVAAIGVVELGAGETGLAGLMAARLLKCPCCLACCAALYLTNCCTFVDAEMQETVFNPNSCENWRAFFSPFFLCGVSL